MNFLEKNLEDFIFNHFDECVERGLEIGFPELGTMQKFRQLRLDPYGIADIVTVQYNASWDFWTIQIIECKRGQIDMHTYMQAKRYRTAMIECVGKLLTDNSLVTCILVGDSIDNKSDFVYAINYDVSCRVFTYSYQFDGIRFENCSSGWHLGNGNAKNDSFLEKIKLLKDGEIEAWQYQQENLRLDKVQQWQKHVFKNGDQSLPLLVTPSGVLFNPNITPNGDFLRVES